jgi:hypothetical protein
MKQHILLIDNNQAVYVIPFLTNLFISKQRIIIDK